VREHNVEPSRVVLYLERKLERTREYLVVMKTTAKCLVELESEVKRLHSYDVPEFIALPITGGSRKYLSWLEESVGKGPKNRK